MLSRRTFRTLCLTLLTLPLLAAVGCSGGGGGTEEPETREEEPAATSTPANTPTATPKPAPPTPTEGPATPTPAPLAAGTYAEFKTSLGDFKVLLYTDKTPKTTQNFIDLVQGNKAYKHPQTSEMIQKPLFEGGRKIFRIIKGFMFQTGSPNDTNSYDAGFNIPDEIVPSLTFDRPGLLAMANTGRPNSGSMQFFVTFDDTPHLNGGYTIFGEVVQGMDTIRAIEQVPVASSGGPRAERSQPVDPPVIHSVTIETVD